MFCHLNQYKEIDPVDFILKSFYLVDYAEDIPEESKSDIEINKEDIKTEADRVYKEMQNPFKRSNNNRVLALSSEDCIDLITDKDIKEFYIKYLKRPSPIILPDSLEGGLSINGITEDADYLPEDTIELPASTHRSILLRAIQLAQMVWKTS
jgi:hypothetical protein